MDCIHSFYSFILCIQCQYLCMWVVYKLGSGVNLYLTNEFYNIIIMIATKDIFPIILYYYSIQSSCQHTNAMSTQWHRQPLLFFYENQHWEWKKFEKNCLGQIARKFAAIVIINVGEWQPFINVWWSISSIPKILWYRYGIILWNKCNRMESTNHN